MYSDQNVELMYKERLQDEDKHICVVSLVHRAVRDAELLKLDVVSFSVFSSP